MNQIDFKAIAAAKGEKELDLNPERTVLIIVDMQRYFVDSNCPFGLMWSRVLPEDATAFYRRVGDLVIPSNQALLECCRGLEVPVYFTAFGSLREDGRDLPRWAQHHNQLCRQMVGQSMYPSCYESSWQICDGLKALPGERVVAKVTSGVLGSTTLDHTLHGLGKTTLIVTGVCTNVCVMQTAREFADRNFQVVVAEDACATIGTARHEAALETFAYVFGRVSSAEQITRALQNQSVAGA
ncbi:MAG: isochorismatase family cysteine hydrolase [Acidobacteriota bacterium]